MNRIRLVYQKERSIGLGDLEVTRQLKLKVRQPVYFGLVLTGVKPEKKQ